MRFTLSLLALTLAAFVAAAPAAPSSAVDTNAEFVPLQPETETERAARHFDEKVDDVERTSEEIAADVDAKTQTFKARASEFYEDAKDRSGKAFQEAKLQTEKGAHEIHERVRGPYSTTTKVVAGTVAAAGVLGGLVALGNHWENQEQRRRAGVRTYKK